MTNAMISSSDSTSLTSIHARSFSTNHATGESPNPNPSVCGRVLCCSKSPLPFAVRQPREPPAQPRQRRRQHRRLHWKHIRQVLLLRAEGSGLGTAARWERA
ncbi:hypothetical protein BFW01_g1508 [Lasiodiplodia theobromae]|nr:hypothetical protein BFW01_g1508 [Lasiodiplodia theobromae]